MLAQISGNADRFAAKTADVRNNRLEKLTVFSRIFHLKDVFPYLCLVGNLAPQNVGHSGIFPCRVVSSLDRMLLAVYAGSLFWHGDCVDTSL